MTPEIKQRIKQIKNGEIPEGFKETKTGVIPTSWKYEKLDSYLIQHHEVSTQNNQYPVLTSSRKGIFFQKQYYDKEVASEDNTGYNVVPRGYFTYRHMSDDEVFVFNINTICDKGIVSTLYPVFSVTNSINPYFLQEMLNNGSDFHRYARIQKQGGSRTYMYFNKLTKLSIPIPSLDEQNRIMEILSSQDKVIECYEKKIEQLKRIKKYYLQNMFPKHGETVPKIRFKGFTDPWEQRKLSDLIEENLKPIPKPDKEYVRLGIRSHAKGTFHEVVAKGAGLDVDTMYVVEADNLIVNITFAWEEAWAITSKEDAEKLVSHRFPQYRFHQGQYPMFYQYRFRNGRMKYNLELASPGGAGRNRVLNKTEFLKIPVIIPTSYKEEKQIGEYFQSLDNLIALHQNKLEKEKKKKKALQQLLLTGIVRVK